MRKWQREIQGQAEAYSKWVGEWEEVWQRVIRGRMKHLNTGRCVGWRVGGKR